MNKINYSKNNYIVVVAHPDDEILWASSIIKNAKKVIICFGKTSSEMISEGRKGFSIKAPKNFFFLNIPEPNDITFDYFPIKSQTSDNNSYLSHFYSNIKEILLELIDSKIVYTHNQWGEYGHLQHIEVNKIVDYICQKKKLKLKVFGYYHFRTIFRRNHFFKKYNVKVEKKEVSKEHFFLIKKQYIENKCWTWFDTYKPKSYEYFYEIIDKVSPYNSSKIFIPGIYLFFGVIQDKLGFHSKVTKKNSDLYFPLLLDFCLFPFYYLSNAIKRFLKKFIFRNENAIKSV